MSYKRQFIAKKKKYNTVNVDRRWVLSIVILDFRFFRA